MNADELKTYFSGKTLPTGRFTISKWETTDNLANVVSMSLDLASEGNRNSLEVLNRIHTKLEEPPAPAQPAMLIKPTELPPSSVI